MQHHDLIHKDLYPDGRDIMTVIRSAESFTGILMTNIVQGITLGKIAILRYFYLYFF